MDPVATQTVGIIADVAIGGPVTAYDLNEWHKRGSIPPA
jgi:Na+/glutamate symporter